MPGETQLGGFINNGQAVRPTTSTDLIYEHPDLFDLAYKGHDGDVNFYVNTTRQGVCLYLGVGTGRVFVPVHDGNENNDVNGIDICPQMVASLFKRYPHISKDRISIKDVRESRFPRGVFDTIVAPYSFLTQFQSKQDVEKILWSVRKGLTDKGVFVTDFFSPFKNPQAKQTLEQEEGLLEDGTQISILRQYDHTRQRIRELTRVRKDTVELTCELPLRYYYPSEIDELASDAGLEAGDPMGNFDQSPFDPGESPVMIYSMRKI